MFASEHLFQACNILEFLSWVIKDIFSSYTPSLPHTNLNCSKIIFAKVINENDFPFFSHISENPILLYYITQL